jgi:outer membrane protein OmpA-like peptidoglycan-associated protein
MKRFETLVRECRRGPGVKVELQVPFARKLVSKRRAASGPDQRESKSRNSCIPIAGIICFIAFGMLSLPARAQQGKLSVHASPPEAYIFVDGKAMKPSNRGMVRGLSAGVHQVGIYNYGFMPVTRSVTIEEKKTAKLDVTLDRVTQTVTKPWGAMTIEGSPSSSSAAVLLNGKTPDYFVGHVDEFNHHWWWKQELVVPAGTHQVTVEHGDTVIWSGSVTVPAGQRVVISTNHGGVLKTVPWPRGDELGAQPRFEAGASSTTVAVAPVTAQLSASATQVNCGTPSQLSWSASGDVHGEISSVGEVPSSGAQAVQPKQTTTYTYTTSGPGGTATSSATVAVNTAIQAALEASPKEVRYHRVDDKVETSPNATLNWSTSNAHAASIAPIGNVNPDGQTSVTPVPQKSTPGPVDETVTYVLTATNSCGGTETRSAAVRLVGSIDVTPPPNLNLNSVYFPTNFPTKSDPQVGLLASQQQVLTDLANEFKNYLGKNPDAHLVLNAHADRRGPKTYNQSLSERRVALVRSYLVDHGVPDGNIETQASGNQNNLGPDQVKQLETENPKLPEDKKPEVLGARLVTTILANNRRVDLLVNPTGQESLKYYPHNADDADILRSRNEPKEDVVTKDEPKEAQ